MKERLLTVLAVVGVIAFVAVCIYASVNAPCSAYGYTPIKDIPGRCYKEYK